MAIGKKEIEYVDVIGNLRVHRPSGRGGLYEPGRISRQQTAGSDTDGCELRAILNEMSAKLRVSKNQNSGNAIVI